MNLPRLKPQEIPFDDPDSCYRALRQVAEEYDGIEYLQVFADESKDEDLWFIEDDDGGAITGLLPSEY